VLVGRALPANCWPDLLELSLGGDAWDLRDPPWGGGTYLSLAWASRFIMKGIRRDKELRRLSVEGRKCRNNPPLWYGTIFLTWRRAHDLQVFGK
jgi:hypothetical protein